MPINYFHRVSFDKKKSITTNLKRSKRNGNVWTHLRDGIPLLESRNHEPTSNSIPALSILTPFLRRPCCNSKRGNFYSPRYTERKISVAQSANQLSWKHNRNNWTFAYYWSHLSHENNHFYVNVYNMFVEFVYSENSKYRNIDVYLL